MSTPLITGDLLKLRVWCSAGDQASVNTIYAVVGAITGGVVTDQDFANYMDAQLSAVFIPVLSNIAEYRGVQASIEDKIPQPSLVISNTNPGNGTAGAIGLPRQTCGLIGFTTPFRGVQYRGRWYIPFPSATDDQGDGTPTAGYEVRIANITGLFGATNFFPGTGSAAAAIVWSIRHGVPKKLPPPLTPTTQITGYTASSKWATQRRRGSFGRQNTVPL